MGDCSLSILLDQLTARGLTTRPTPKWPAKPLTITTLHKLLHNPYYKGQVRYKGVCYDDVHEPLVDPATWQQVQDLLAAHAAQRRGNESGGCPARHDPVQPAPG